MDDRGFDALARALGGAATRRGALGVLAGLLAGGAALEADAKKQTRKGGGPQAAGKRRNRKRCKPECTGNFSCIKGQCTCEQALCGAACCDDGQVCQRGRCVGQGTVFCHDLGEACGDGAPCCDGLLCGSGQGGGPVACWPKPGEQCDADAECLYGHSCIDNACVADAPPPAGPDCTPTTCAAAGASCGEIPDGCDGTLECGTCSGGQTCEAGTCACPSGQALCAAACTDTQTDAANCGACGTACTGGKTCQAGACAYPPITQHVASFGTKWTNQTLSGTDGTLREPMGLRLNAAGDLAYIADYGSDRIVAWRKTGAGIGDWTHVASFGASGTATGASQTDGTLDGPAGMAFDADQNRLFVADYKNDRIVVWEKTGANPGDWQHTASFGVSGSATGASQTDGKLNDPNDVAVHESGTVTMVYVLDLLNSRIAVWKRDTADATPAWSHVASFGAECYSGLGATDGCIPYPYGVAIDAAGTRLWITDGNGRVVVWEKTGSGDGAWSHVASVTTISGPYYTWPDAAGTSAWATANGKVWAMTRGAAGWATTSSFGTGGVATGATDGKLNQPRGVVVSADASTAWVVDNANGRVAIWTT